MKNNNKNTLLLAALKEVINDGTNVEITVYGLSMFPTYLPGDVVTVSPINYNTLKVGDTVFFEGNEKVIFHRLTKKDKNNERFLTKGDGLYWYDKPISKKELLAVCIQQKRKDRILRIRNKRISKNTIVFLTPILGYFTFVLARIWYKLKK